MPKVLNWNLIDTFDNESSLELFLLTHVQTSTGKSNLTNCTICLDKGHKMIYQLRSYSSAECNDSKECTYCNKILKCCRTKKIHLYSLHSHNIPKRSKSDRNHGLTNVVKELIEQLIFEKNISRPKKLLVELGANKEIEMPSMDQIRNFVKYRRLKLEDSNNMEGVKEFVNTHTYFPGYDCDRLFGLVFILESVVTRIIFIWDLQL
jgi:hypothetical protein